MPKIKREYVFYYNDPIVFDDLEWQVTEEKFPAKNDPEALRKCKKILRENIAEFRGKEFKPEPIGLEHVQTRTIKEWERSGS